MNFIHLIQGLTKELWICIGFVSLFIIVTIRLIQLEIVRHDYYDQKLIEQHYQHINIKAKRGNILIESPSGQSIKLTSNASRYDIFIDPKFVIDKEKVISDLTPVLMQHFCPQGEVNQFMDPQACLYQLQRFTKKELLPQKPQLFYLGSGIANSTGLINLPTTITGMDKLRAESQTLITQYQESLVAYQQALDKLLNEISYTEVRSLIREQLATMISQWIKKRNYLTPIEDPALEEALLTANLPFVIFEDGLLYVIPMEEESDRIQAASQLYTFLSQHQIILPYKTIKDTLAPQENRYVKIASDLNQELATKLKERKEYRRVQKAKELADKRRKKIKYTEEDMIPLLHGLGFEEKTIREYPFGSFASHILGYLDKNGNPITGVEEFRDTILKGKDGQIIWFGAPGAGQNGADDLQLSNPINGSDITLTIDPNIQKKIEEMTAFYLDSFKADSVSIIVMNPYNGNIAGLANAPTFNPNKVNEVYGLKPVDPEYARIIDDPQYLDIPVYAESGWVFLPVPRSERSNYKIPKYMNTNYFWPMALVDKNTALAYEPGSIFKGITAAIGLDVDEIGLYDTYYDKGELQVGDYFISNVSSACLGTNTFLHALQFSCNIGMIHIIQKIGQPIFYNYLEKFGFGKKTGIEIAGEVSWSIPNSQNKEKSRFFNNSFWQGLLVTPIQMAMSYSTLVNGGYVVAPTIIKKITSYDGTIKQATKVTKKLILKAGVSELMKMALYEVVNGGQIKKFSLVWKTLAGKTSTSQIAFRGQYQNGVGWTNGSFAGIVTKENTKYTIVIQVRRPRTNQRWELTAGAIYGELAKFLIEYEDIEK